MSERGRESITDKPPSTKLVYTILEHRGAQTQKQLIEESMLSPRTVRYALTDFAEYASHQRSTSDTGETASAAAPED